MIGLIVTVTGAIQIANWTMVLVETIGILADQSTTQRAITATHKREVGTLIVSASRRESKEENENEDRV